MAIGRGAVVDHSAPIGEAACRLIPASQHATGDEIRVPCVGSLRSLQECYSQYLDRFVSNESTILESAVPIFDLRPYQVGGTRPHTVFKLLDDDNDTVAYSHARLIHIAGMVRHSAIELMTRNPPRDLRGHLPEQWVDQYVAGHKPRSDESDDQPHTQFSYIPLPSTGHEHADPAVRRVMIVAPLGDEAWLDHLTQNLDGQRLVPLPGTPFPPGTRLERISDESRDGVRFAYTRESRSWASFTPVILPGHDDRKPDKTRKLILKALAQFGVDQHCEFEWSAFSRFPKSYSAHKYTRDESASDGKRPVGYFRPDHLLHQTAVHVQLHFDRSVPGPITLGAGRHCGFGLFAASGIR